MPMQTLQCKFIHVFCTVAVALPLFPWSQQIHGSAVESKSRLSPEWSGAPPDTALACILNFGQRMRRRPFVSVCLSLFSSSLSCFFGEGNIPFSSCTVFTSFSSLSLFSNCQRNSRINLNSSVLEVLPNLLLVFFLVPFPFSQAHKHEEIDKAASLYSL